MKISEKHEKLMEFIYDEYNNSSTFQGHGEFPIVLVERFQRASGIRFGDGYAQLAAIDYFLKQGWIEIVSINGRSLGGALHLYSRIKPTHKGNLHVEEGRKLWLQKHGRAIYESTIAGIIKGLKK